MELSKSGVLLLTLSVIGVGSLAYLLFSKEEEVRQLNSGKRSEVQMQIPKSCVGLVIGRQGATVKMIEKTSGARVQIGNSRSTDEHITCRISGTAESVDLAQVLLQDIILNQPLIEIYEMAVPVDVCGRLIGKNGSTIRNISHSSNAKITISREPVSGNQRSVTIEGTAEQIAAARVLINQKVTEEREYQSRVEQSVGNRSPRHQPKHLMAGPATDGRSDVPLREKLVPTSNDGLLEVYVSSIESPERLWLQVKGPCTVELDKLHEKMTEHYSKPEMREIHALHEVRIGQIVAAPFMYDDKYYRAEVLSEENNELNLYYLDYGDYAVCSKTHAFDLRTEFLKLRFQAIETMLARIKPRDDAWSEEAVDLMEELTHVALWKPLTAKIHSYLERPTRAKREGSPVPCVDLYDTSGPKEVNVAEELVAKGFAVWIDDHESHEIDVEVNPGEGAHKIALQASNNDSGCDDEEIPH